jgi:hypothetical protein
LIGPGDLVDCPTGPLQNERVAFSEGLNLAEKNQIMVDKNSPSINVVQESLTRIRIGRYDPLSTFSVMLRLNDLYQGDEYAFFQYIVRFIDVSRQSLVTRISSHRLSVANDVGEFLEAIDEEVVPVLLAKEAVYRAMFGRDADIDHPFHSAYIDEVDSFAYDAQQDLDNTVFRISAAFRLLSLVQGTKRYVKHMYIVKNQRLIFFINKSINSLFVIFLVLISLKRAVSKQQDHPWILHSHQNYPMLFVGCIICVAALC